MVKDALLRVLDPRPLVLVELPDGVDGRITGTNGLAHDEAESREGAGDRRACVVLPLHRRDEPGDLVGVNLVEPTRLETRQEMRTDVVAVLRDRTLRGVERAD